MTLLQIRTAAPQAVNVNDVTALLNQATTAISVAVPKLIAIAYFIVVCIILWRLWKTKMKGLPMMELIGLAIVFGLMR